MASQLETVSTLGRKLSLSVALAEVERDVAQRLRNIARTAKMPGFRPGKVPMRMIEQSYGAQVQSEVLGDAVSKAFNDAVTEHSLRVAGQPSIERQEGTPEGELGFSASFEVYPEIVLGDFAALAVERYTCEVGEAEVDKTIDILRKQRAPWVAAQRPAADGDRITVDFKGTLDGTPFDGGTAEGFQVVLGQGRMLPDFEAGLRGASAGDTPVFPVAFPADYGAAELAGKTAQFETRVALVEAQQLPELDAAFATSLGVPDGSVEKLRADVRANLEREVAQRLRARTKASVMQVLPAVADFELPAALVDAESATLGERARADLKQRGVDIDRMPPIPPDTFKEQATGRVRLGLLVGELVRARALQAKPDQLRKQVEEFAQSYENPGELIRHYFSDRNRLAEVEAIVVEQNVVDWVLANAKVSDKALPFDELMAG
ncbi:MAG: trigger factor [Betaproteobacteria bacterium]|nr:trigger factor [Betaproteobacteria bacterium]